MQMQPPPTPGLMVTSRGIYAAHCEMNVEGKNEMQCNPIAARGRKGSPIDGVKEWLANVALEEVNGKKRRLGYVCVYAKQLTVLVNVVVDT